MTGQADSLVCFVVMLMKASWKDESDNTNDRDWMLKIQQVVTDSGKESFDYNLPPLRKPDQSLSRMWPWPKGQVNLLLFSPCFTGISYR